MPCGVKQTALAKAKRQGLTRHIGVANFNIALLDEAIRLCPEPLVTLQAEYHPHLDQAKLTEACRRRGLRWSWFCGRLLLARGNCRNAQKQEQRQEIAIPVITATCPNHLLPPGKGSNAPEKRDSTANFGREFVEARQFAVERCQVDR